MGRQTIGLSVLMLAAIPVLLGMGAGGGGTVSDTIPKPKENFSAELLDRQGITTRVGMFTCDGKTFLPLRRGEGMLTVSFAKVVRVKFGQDKGPNVETTIQVQAGKSLEGELPRGLECTGSTEYGNYRVEARGLKEIVFVRP